MKKKKRLTPLPVGRQDQKDDEQRTLLVPPSVA